ncbi:MAG: RluA family pseudouridine synthase [bacterium]|nr:RluA family pseudouridine synthase [bacterium]
MEAPKVLYEDLSLLVINKPSGMVVNRAESVKGETLQDWVESYLKLEVGSENVDKEMRGGKSHFTPQSEAIPASHVSHLTSSEDFISRSGVVHRIDKETSGVLIIAKTPEAFEELQRQFKEREVEKTYVALVHGRVSPEEGIINAPVGRLPWNRERFGVFPGGREAETKYQVVRYYPASHISPSTSYSLVEFYPKTGRTHQIRVHAKSIGHVIVSDIFYAGRKTSRRDRTWCPRLFLHASLITFTHPDVGKRMKVEAPLPQDLQSALDALTP